MGGWCLFYKLAISILGILKIKHHNTWFMCVLACLYQIPVLGVCVCVCVLVCAVNVNIFYMWGVHNLEGVSPLFS